MTLMDLERITANMDVTVKGAPTYTVSEVAKWFFGRSAHWVRWLDRNGQLTRDNGVRIGKIRASKNEARAYNLADVEDMALLLAERDAITAVTRDRALEAIRLQAEIHRMFDEPYLHEGRTYPYTVGDVAIIAGRSTTWVRTHADLLGGLKTLWDDDKLQESWRFPDVGLPERITRVLESV